jgi:hypothetical protein
MKSVIDTSTYFENMTKLDLIARNIQTKDLYKKIYLDSIIPFSNNQKKELEYLIDDINNILKNYKNISLIPWKIIKILPEIELGFPHTLGDIIILSDKFFSIPYERQKKILIHEKIHIYQRIYPIETNELILNIMNFEIKKQSSFVKKRSNPDINNISYGKKNYYIAQIYNSFNPKSIVDSKAMQVNEKTNEIIREANLLDEMNEKESNMPNDIQLEHPYEIMASFLPYIILQQKINIKISKWMNKYL